MTTLDLPVPEAPSTIVSGWLGDPLGQLLDELAATEEYRRMLLIVRLKPAIRVVRLVQLGRRRQVQLVARDQVNVFPLVVPLQRPEARRLAVAVVLGPDLDAFPQVEVQLGRRDHPVAASPARCGARVEVGLALERP